MTGLSDHGRVRLRTRPDEVYDIDPPAIGERARLHPDRGALAERERVRLVNSPATLIATLAGAGTAACLAMFTAVRHRKAGVDQVGIPAFIAVVRYVVVPAVLVVVPLRVVKNARSDLRNDRLEPLLLTGATGDGYARAILWSRFLESALFLAVCAPVFGACYLLRGVASSDVGLVVSDAAGASFIAIGLAIAAAAVLGPTFRIWPLIQVLFLVLIGVAAGYSLVAKLDALAFQAQYPVSPGSFVWAWAWMPLTVAISAVNHAFLLKRTRATRRGTRT
jgi:uncharacterized membrane protein